MQDPTLLPEELQARAVSSLKSALARFRRSTDPPNADDAKTTQARVRGALTDSLLHRIVPSTLRDIPADRTSSFLYLLFFAGESRGNMGPGGTGSVTIRVHVLTRAAEILWVASLAMGALT